MLDPHDAAVEVDRAPLLADLVARGLPHLTGAEPGILEAVDQGLDHLPVGDFREAAEEGVPDRAEQAQTLDPLRRPVGRDRVSSASPRAFSV